MPPFLLPVRDRAAAFAGLAPECLQHVLITEYRPGAAIGWHRDRANFDDVIGVSLLSPCTFRMRRRRGSDWERAATRLDRRSVYLMRGPARDEWEHSIPAVDELRYSITFRSVRSSAEVDACGCRGEIKTNRRMVERQRNPSPLRVPRCYAPAATNYRRNFLAGGRFFFTLNLTDRRQRLLTDNIAFAAPRLQGRTSSPSLRNRCNRRAPRSSTHYLDAARRRRRLCRTLAADQIDIFAGPSPRRGKPCPKQERGIWQRRY